MTRQLLIFSCSIVLAIATAGAQSGDFVPQQLHPEVGEVIDATENSHYRIFGEIEGFTSARFYQRGETSYHLHLLRNHEGCGQILLLQLSPVDFQGLRSRLEHRLQALQRGEAMAATPLYQIAEGQWQERGDLRKIVLRDGTTINGELQRVQGDTLFVRTPGGLQIPVPDAQIVEVTALHGDIRAGTFYRADPNASRLLLAPTGRGLPAGQGYFADYYLFFPTLAVGVTDYFAVSGGVSILPGADSQLAYFGAKFTWPLSSRVGLSTGLLHLAIPEETDDGTLGYAVATFGSARNAVTLGAAYPFNANIDARPVLLVGAETQVSSSVKLLTENWIFTGANDSPVLFSGGVRFFGEKLAVDLALLSTQDLFDSDVGFPFVPWVDFSVFFGR